MLGTQRGIRPPIFRRYKRKRGYNVLHPMGWMPRLARTICATHRHSSAITTAKNVENSRANQGARLQYDWDREGIRRIQNTMLDTVDLHQLYRKGLAYIAEVPVNWRPELGTVLANEEVIDGK